MEIFKVVPLLRPRIVIWGHYVLSFLQLMFYSTEQSPDIIIGGNFRAPSSGDTVKRQRLCLHITNFYSLTSFHLLILLIQNGKMKLKNVGQTKAQVSGGSSSDSLRLY